MKIEIGLLAASLGMVLSLSACSKPTNEGAAQKTTGQVESAVGSVTGDESLKSEGQKDEVVGGVKDAAHDLKEAAGAATH